MHSILESYFKGEADFFELLEIYERDYKKNVKERFPYNWKVDLNESYYKQGIAYLSTFEGLPDNYDVVSVEDKANMVISGRPFVGYIDLVLQDKEDGQLLIWDHKSKAAFKSKAEYHHYLRQLYLYGQYVKEKYGQYPKELVFNMCRVNQIVSSEFDPEELQATLDWFTNTIEKIYADTEFNDKISILYYEKFKDINEYKPGSDFFCANLCGVRNFCERSGCMKKQGKRSKYGA